MSKDLIPPPRDAMSSQEGSESDFSGSNESGTGSDTAPNEPKEEVIAKQETKAVGRLRLVVLVVLATAAVGIAASVYFYLTSNEMGQFRQQFDDDANKILNAVGNALDKSMASFDSVAVTLVSTARMTNQSWPFVTVDDFAVRLSKVLPLSSAVMLAAFHVVSPEQREEWETYAAEHDGWVHQGLKVQEKWGGYYAEIDYDGMQNPVIHGFAGDVPRNESRTMLASWQTFPCTSSWSYSWDVLTILNPSSYLRSMEQHKAVMLAPYMVASPDDEAQLAQDISGAEYYKSFLSPDEEPQEPMSDLLYPIVSTVDDVRVAGAPDYNPADHQLVGLLSGSIYWRTLLREILPTGSDGIHVVFSNPCSNSFTYVIKGPKVEYMGVGDHHESKYTQDGESKLLHALSSEASHGNSVYTGAPLDESYCPITLHVYPSNEMRDRFTSSDPEIFTVAVILIFAFVSLVFFLYDLKVERRQVTVMNTAVRSSAIVSSLFPSEVRDRLYPNTNTANSSGTALLPDTAKGKLNSFLRESRSVSSANMTNGISGGAPIAELYPDTTVLFADISGFTAWSSERSPTQVFTLLETVYGAFDAIAKKRGVFKVETIGDCYVAVVGLPTPRRNHAIVMARFAHDCREKMMELSAELAKTLGPGTADLAMRFGMNSGPTTAGVLRGEKSRFQLFGDTVNTAARMESNGLRNKIQVSQKTADLLRLAGKEHWLTQRDEKVDCKGKGMMTTYWVEPIVAAGGSVYSMSDQSEFHDEPVVDAHDSKIHRLVDWNVSMFTELLTDVVASRANSGQAPREVKTVKPLHEVQKDIALLESSRTNKETSDIAVSQAVTAQLRELLWLIADGYRSNEFHNFEHCSHVVMSTKKLLDRITEREKEVQRDSQSVVNCTYGITAHPLHKLAIVFAALIHDLDHSGVSNAQLVHENDPLAVTYHGQSVAEQNSVQVAWKLLMQPKFADLRQCMYANDAELTLFRQVVSHAVIATDLFDKTLKAARESRWDTSFANGSNRALSLVNDMGPSSTKATIVIELIIQASDVSHTMQHFTVYKKWNLKLLAEMHAAYRHGRMAKDPTIGWYEGELWFFDHYIIPLAQKLRECHVFGVSCDEFLDYANDNRTEWEMKGRDIVRDAKEALERADHPVVGTGSVVEI